MAVKGSLYRIISIIKRGQKIQYISTDPIFAIYNYSLVLRRVPELSPQMLFMQHCL